MEIKKIHIIGIVFVVIGISVSYILFMMPEEPKPELFYFITGLAFVAGAFPFIVSLMLESSKEKENNDMFLEFSRNLVESVKSGTPISRSIINLRYKHYGSLTPYIQKLANQISLGISVKSALEIFARDTNSKMILRSVTLISEAEKAGGEIENILESVAKSVSEIENLKKERRFSIYNLVVQGYIIFFVFIAIMLIMQFKIMPMTSEISKVSEGGGGGFGMFGESGEKAVDFNEIVKPMFYLLILQGFFTGLVIGKLAEGNFKAGIKHSFALIALSILIYTGVKAFLV